MNTWFYIVIAVSNIERLKYNRLYEYLVWGMCNVGTMRYNVLAMYMEPYFCIALLHILVHFLKSLCGQLQFSAPGPIISSSVVGTS